MEYFYSGKGLNGLESMCKECRKDQSFEWRKDNPEYFREYSLKTKFGMTKDQYRKMVRDQDGKCLICMTHEDDLPESLAVDHCHTTGNIRGLLCRACNMSLGGFRDNTTFLVRGIIYLNKTKRGE